MAVVAEFISVLRKIRDVIYPQVNALYEDSLVLKESIDVGKAEFDADFAQFTTDYATFNMQKDEVDEAITSAQASASSASASATIATNKSNEIKGITAQSTTGAPGTSASASYNPTDGKFTFVIPQGSKGDKGESFTVNSSGVTASRVLYDNQPIGWSFLDVNVSLLYFKVSSTSGDWSAGVPFGKGDIGETGEEGVGIVSFKYISTNHISGLPAQSGGTDTYRVILTNALTFDYQVYNGLDASLTYVDEQIDIVQENIDTVSTQISSHINLSGITAYHLIQGDLSVSNEVITNGFSTTLYTGNGGTQRINTGIDMSTQWGNDASETFGGLVWLKSRSAATNNFLFDTIRGALNEINSNTTEAQASLANSLKAFNNDGFSVGSAAGINVNAATYTSWNFQTTHRRTGVTNHGKAYTEHYNPFTGFTIIKYEGSGLTGHEIPHSLGRKLSISIIKNLSAVSDLFTILFGINNYLFLNYTTAGGGAHTHTSNELNITLDNIGYDASTNQYIMYGWSNSYFDEANTLIGNYEVGVYQGTGVAGNKVKTRGKPAWVMIKRLDSTGNWDIYDNGRVNGHLFPNANIAEIIASTVSFYDDGFTMLDTNAERNASGGQYLYMVVYDNDSGSGKSKYPKATDTTNLSINALVPYANGIDINGSKVSIEYKNETITGLTLAQGKNYLYSKNDGTYGVSSVAPSYGIENPLTGDFFNLKTLKWYDSANTEITPRTYLDCVVYADHSGQVTYVEELPKTTYFDEIKANKYKGKNACTAWVNFDGTTTPPTIRDSYNIASVVRTATGIYEIYFSETMDTTNYTMIGSSGGQGSTSNGAVYDASNIARTVDKMAVITPTTSSGTVNTPFISVEFKGGKN